MAVKIRLARRGKKQAPIYDILVANSTAPRDGRFIEKLGTYQPVSHPATILLNEERALYWLLNGAQPTDTARNVLQVQGVLYKKHLQVGVNKGAITQEVADERFAAWKSTKEGQVSGLAKSLADRKEADKKARFEAETKVNQARLEAQQAALAALNATEEVAEEAAAEETQEENAAEAPAESAE